MRDRQVAEPGANRHTPLALGLALALLVPVLPAPAFGLQGPTVTLTASRLSGHTTYRISVPFTEDGTPFEGESELEFPLDVFLAGVEVSVGSRTDGPWSLTGVIRRSVNDPGDPMKDVDSITEVATGTAWTISYSESEASLAAWEARIELARRFRLKESFALAALVGYRYSRLSYEIRGARGWYDDGSGRFDYDMGTWLHVLDYRVSYHLPLAGLSAKVRASSWLEAELGARFSPHAVTTDHDDHILRMKTAEATSTGRAYLMDLRVRAAVAPSEMQQAMFLEVRVEWVDIEADGDQTQEWYGDDPVTSEDDTGKSFSGIDDEIDAPLMSLGLALGLCF